MNKTTITSGELEQVGIALSGLVNKENLPFRICRAIAKLTIEVEKELKILTDIRQKLVKTHAAHNETDKPIEIEDPVTKQKITFQKGQLITAIDPVTKQQVYTFKDDATKETYLKELGDLLKMNIDIEHLTISSKLMEEKNVSFTPMQMKVLMFMIDDETKPEEKK